jgi:DNA-binding NarL/FixJ family response regulator
VETPRDRFVGRIDELALLNRRLGVARDGTGSLVLIGGAAGIGKTRLVEEFVAGVEGVDVGWGAALDDAGMPALWPWTRALRRLRGPSAALVSVTEQAARIEWGSAVEASAAWFAAFTTVVDELAEHALARQGMLVVLEDLHWADGPTLRLLERVVAEVRRLPILVVATHRDVIGGPLEDALPRLAAGAGTEVVRLAPLEAEEAAALLLDAVEGADPSAVRDAVQSSGGSPLYLHTLARVGARHLREGKASEGIGGAPEFRQLVSAALHSAGPAAEVVEILSVFGVETKPAALAQLLGLGAPSAAVELLRPAVPAGLVNPPAVGENIQLAHALVRDAVYASLAPERRTALHHRAAEVLEQQGAGSGPGAGEVALHWLRAGRPGRAGTWAARAAKTALDAGAFDEAASHLRLALDTLDRDLSEATIDRAELLLELARVEYLAGHITQSMAACRRAAAEGERSRRPEIVASAALVLQGIGDPSMNRQLVRLCQQALSTADALTPAMRSRVEAQLSCALLEVGDFDQAAQWSESALARARTSGDPNAELDAIHARAYFAYAPPIGAELVELGRRAIELAVPAGRPLAQMWGHVWRSDAEWLTGNMAAVLRENSALEALAESTGLPLVRWHALRRRATLAALAGQFNRARQLSRDATDLSDAWQDASAQGVQFGFSVRLALLRGDPGDLPARWADDLVSALAGPPVAQAVAAAALMVAGRHDEAWTLCESLMAEPDQPTERSLAVLSYLGDLTAALGDPASCRLVRDRMKAAFKGAVAEVAGTVFYMGSIPQMLGQLDLACGDFSDAQRHFEDGLRIDAMFGAHPYVALGRMGLARALRELGKPQGASELARAAAAGARRLDMPGLLREADAFLLEIAAAARAKDPLTPREREVASLVAQALSNRDIATRLVLSERTVESHVRSILAKTGRTSRTDLVRWLLNNSSDR